MLLKQPCLASPYKFIKESIGLRLLIALRRKSNEIICMHVLLNNNVDYPQTLYQIGINSSYLLFYK